MPTFDKRVADDRVLIEAVAAIAPFTPSSPMHSTIGLVDTGAQCTLITERVTRSLGAAPVDRSGFVAANGQLTHTKVYVLHIALPIQVRRMQEDGSLTKPVEHAGMALEVMSLPWQPPDHDLILGMDFLANFHITMWNGQFIISN